MSPDESPLPGNARDVRLPRNRVVQSILIVLLGVPALVLLLALFGWIVSFIYQAFTGHPPPDADMFPHDGEAVWRLTSSSSVYVVGDTERAGSGLNTLAVDDLDAYASKLRAGGLALTERSGGDAPRRLMITDDDGNSITFFQDPTLPVG